MKNELKPCPFCGGRDLVYTPIRDCIECNTCQAEGPADIKNLFLNEDRAIKLWNTRAGETQ